MGHNKMAYEEEEEEGEKVAMEILRNEFDWYSGVTEYMEKTFEWSELQKEDRRLFLDVLTEMGRTLGKLCDFMDAVEIHCKDLSNLKSLINDERAKFYNYMFEIFSPKVSDVGLKDYLASFQPSTNSLPFPDSDSDSKEGKDGVTSSQSEKSSISSNTEPEMVTRKRKRSPGEEEESNGSGVIHHPLPQSEMIAKIRKSSPGEEAKEDSDGSSDAYYLVPPMVLSTYYHTYKYPDCDPTDLNYRFAEDENDYFD